MTENQVIHLKDTPYCEGSGQWIVACGEIVDWSQTAVIFSKRQNGSRAKVTCKKCIDAMESEWGDW